jgi:hypothetical protein
MYYSEDLEDYFLDIEDFVSRYLKDFDDDVILEELPDYLLSCDRVRPAFPTALELARIYIQKGYISSVENLIESIEANFYNDAVDYYPIPNWNGKKDLQDAINLFSEINTFIRCVFSNLSFYRYRYFLGLKTLDKALISFAEANNHHVLYYPNKEKEPIPFSYWLEAIIEREL